MLSTVELCAAAGVTYRQVDYWTRTGYLVPVLGGRGSGKGRERWYDPDEIRVAKALRALLRADAETLAVRVRNGGDGQVEVAPGVIIDLDVLDPPSGLTRVA